MTKSLTFWKSVKFINQWQLMPPSLFLGWIIGYIIIVPAKKIAEDSYIPLFAIELIFLWFLLSLFYQMIIGLDLDSELRKIVNSIEADDTKILNIHSQLNDLRDRLIFEDDDKYWDILEGLANKASQN